MHKDKDVLHLSVFITVDFNVPTYFSVTKITRSLVCIVNMIMISIHLSGLYLTVEEGWWT